MKLAKYVSGFFLVLVMSAMMGCASSGSSIQEDLNGYWDSVGVYWDDSVATTKVKKAIYDEPRLKVSDISVKTVKGIVYLEGYVERKGDISKAVAVARKVEGVRSVKSSLKLKKDKKALEVMENP